jgi:hypothetical protein
VLPIADGTTFARLSERLPVVRHGVFSCANENDRYMAWIELAAAPKLPVFLSVNGGVLIATTLSGGARHIVAFETDRARADALSAIWNVPRKDRVPLGAGLVARFRAKEQPFAANGPMEIVFEVRNEGTSPISFPMSVQKRSVRDNRFFFVVERDGVSLPVVDALDLNSRRRYMPLPPGGTLQSHADLAKWTPIRAADTYRVHCCYEANLTADVEGAEWPDGAHRCWKLALTGSIDITVC